MTLPVQASGPWNRTVSVRLPSPPILTSSSSPYIVDPCVSEKHYRNQCQCLVTVKHTNPGPSYSRSISLAGIIDSSDFRCCCESNGASSASFRCRSSIEHLMYGARNEVTRDFRANLHRGTRRSGCLEIDRLTSRQDSVRDILCATFD